MYITPDVEIPETVIDALRDGRLVVFVGAGASMDPPSGLPHFVGLTERLCRDAQRLDLKPQIRQHPDVVLSRLEDGGVPVHERVREIIGDPGSTPNRLHAAIVGLFTGSEDVRIVTTNYDQHLETAIVDRWSGGVSIERAPALPVGRDFRGLVYLHGSVTQEAQRLVVTDRDFGRAYLTEAWAARFLEAMFSEYTALFIGYSHGDTVMTYLARGLSTRAQPRFALVSSKDDPDYWRRLNVNPVFYPIRKGNRPHLSLRLAVEAWGDRSRMQLLDHASRIRTLVSGQPPADPVSVDYLVDAAFSDDTAPLFTGEVEGPTWMDWITGQDGFRALVDPVAVLTEAQRHVAWWFAGQTQGHVETALGLFQQLGGNLNPLLWQALVTHLWRAQRDGQPIGRLLGLLLRAPPAQTGPYLGYMLADCQWATDRSSALLLFDYLAEPQLVSRPSFGDALWYQVEVRADEHDLRRGWDKVLKPHLADCADDLKAIIERHIRRAHLLLEATGSATDTSDQLSVGRAAIEPHGQDGYPSGVDVLIDACRDVLEHLLVDQPEAGRAWLDTLERSNVPLLRRLAVHGWTARQDASSDEKLTWLLDAGMVWDWPAKHEVFRLVGQSTPGASLPVKERLLGVIAAGSPQDQPPSEPDDRHNAYLVYNYLVWLARSDPGFASAQLALDEIAARNPDFQPREHPDLDRWVTVGSVITPISWQVDQVRSWQPAQLFHAAEEVLTEDAPGFRPEWYDISRIVTSVIRQDPAYGLRLISALDEEPDEERRSKWLAAAAQGWMIAELDEGAWGEALEALKSSPYLMGGSEDVTRLLADGMQRRANRLPDAALLIAGDLADVIWSGPDQPRDDRGDGRWLEAALGHWSGRLAEFWVHVIERRWRSAGDAWSGLDGEMKTRLETMISGGDQRHRLARVILASQFDFLAGADFDWAVANILPVLNWSVDAQRAGQAWNGFLTWGRWNDRTLPFLMPLYLAAVHHLQGDLAAMRERLTEHWANIALYGDIDTITWLEQFIATAHPTDRSQWADALAHALDRAPTEYAEAAFGRWINRYWRRRLQGIPTALTAEEGRNMVAWPLRAGQHFPQAVSLLTATPLDHPEQLGYLFRRLRDSHLVGRYPSETTSFLVDVLRPAVDPLFDAEAVHQIVTTLDPALTTDRDRQNLRVACSEIMRLGHPEASGWMASS